MINSFLALPLYLQVVIGLVVLVLADFAVGLGKALVTRTLSAQKLPSFLDTTIPVDQLKAFALAVFAAAFQPDGTLSSTALVATVVTGGSALAVKILADIAGKIA